MNCHLLNRKFKIKLLILISILIFSLQSWTKADDISDFEIEGISIGDSLLDYYDINEIEINKRDYYVSPEFVAVKMLLDSEIYHLIDVHYKKDSNLLLLKTEMDEGHFGGSDRYKYMKELAFSYIFVLKSYNLLSTNTLYNIQYTASMGQRIIIA